MFHKIYYTATIALSGTALILAVLYDSIPIAIMGGAYLLSFEIERLKDSILAARHTEKPQPVKTPPKPLFKAKSKPTDEEIKHEKLMANIDAYDGTGKGQVKI